MMAKRAEQEQEHIGHETHMFNKLFLTKYTVYVQDIYFNSYIHLLGVFSCIFWRIFLCGQLKLAFFGATKVHVVLPTK